MNVAQLIEVLQKVEDKENTLVSFTYDTRAGGGWVHCVDLSQAMNYEHKEIVFRSETTEDYHHFNPNHDPRTDDEVYKEAYEWSRTRQIEFYDDANRLRAGIKMPGADFINREAEKDADRALRHHRSAKEETKNDINLFLE